MTSRADQIRALLTHIGGLHPAVAEDAPLTRLPGIEEPWITGGPDQTVINLVADHLPALPNLLRAKADITAALGTEVELRLVDIVDTAPDD